MRDGKERKWKKLGKDYLGSDESSRGGLPNTKEAPEMRRGALGGKKIKINIWKGK